MRLKYKTYKLKKEFGAVLICEHCDSEMKVTGNSSKEWENQFLPKLRCAVCKKNRKGESGKRFFRGSESP